MNTDKIEEKTEEIIKKYVNKTKVIQEISVETAVDILKDKYHERLRVSDIKDKYKLNDFTYKYVIDEFSDIFIKKFGKYKKPITEEQMILYIDNLNI